MRLPAQRPWGKHGGKHVVNPAGHLESLRPPEHGNTRALKHGCYWPRAHEERALVVYEELQALPWITAADSLAVTEVARLVARIELIDEALDEDGRVEDTK